MIEAIDELHSEPLHAHLTRVGLTGFVMAVVLLIFHIPLTTLTGLPINAAASALVPAGIALIALRDDQRKKILVRVDGESILFFAGLFMLIGGLEKVHLFGSLAMHWQAPSLIRQMLWSWRFTGDRGWPAALSITSRWRWQ
ncbi:MAG: hypothetical protein IPJ46_13715 [Anaerolineales bacterium]|nr:hypothetical protein [Anaerolineales bacterium]